MVATRSWKPIVSSLLALLIVLGFVIPVASTKVIAGPATPFDFLQAGTIHWVVIFFFAFLWLGIQMYWKASAEMTKLGMAASATIIWLAVAFFYDFNSPATPDMAIPGGAVAFFTVMGGLGVVLLWVRFLSDELSF